MSNIKKWLLVLVGVVLFVGMPSVLADDINKDPALNSSSIQTSVTSKLESEDKLLPQKSNSIPKFPGGANPVNDGISFVGIGLTPGFTVQPQETQNIVVGSPLDLQAEFSIGLFLFNESVPIIIHCWSYNETSGQWDDQQVNTTIKFSLLNLRTLETVPTEEVPTPSKPGDYYYQIVATRSNGSQYNSAVAHVNVVSQEIHASGLDLSSPDVVFGGTTGSGSLIDPYVKTDINYNSQANITPNEATDSVQWQDSNGIVSYMEPYGLTNKFTVDNTKVNLNVVNTSVNNPGVPINIHATVVDSQISADRTVYDGGLVAVNAVKGRSFIWPVAGLQELANVTGNQISEIAYEWHFYKGSTNTEVTPKSTDTSVMNIKGTVNNVTDLSSDGAKALKINDGTFMTNAYQATQEKEPYSAQLKITFKVAQGTSFQKTVTVLSNRAQFSVIKPAQQLSLDSVPDFNFGPLSANQLYQGVTVNSTSANQLAITAQGVDNWTLSAERAAFFSQQTGVNEPILTLMGLPNQPAIKVGDGDEHDKTLLTSDQANGQTSWTVGGQLTLPPNPQLQLANNQQFNSAITWILNGPSPE